MEKKKKRPGAGYYEINKVTPIREKLPLTVLCGNTIYNGMHWHHHIEMVVCLYGAFSIRVESEIYRLTEGDFILINGGDSHEVFAGIKDGLQIICSIEPSLFRDSQVRYDCRSVGEGAIPKESGDAKQIRSLLCGLAYLQTPDMEEMKQKILVRNRKEWAEQLSEKERIEAYRSFYESILESDEEWYNCHADIYRLLGVLSKYKYKEEGKKQEKKSQEELERCIAYIHEHYQEKLTVRRLAEEINVSEPSLYRIFQNGMSLTPVTYIHAYRVHMACALLQDPRRKVSDVALESGFSNLSNFYRTFENHMKMSPREYRKRHDMAVAGEGMFTHQSILESNVFQNFFELPYTKEVFLNYTTEDERGEQA